MLRQLEVEEGFPRKISDLGFPSRITSVDAALHFRNDRYTVFFAGQVTAICDIQLITFNEKDILLYTELAAFFFFCSVFTSRAGCAVMSVHADPS